MAQTLPFPNVVLFLLNMKTSAGNIDLSCTSTRSLCCSERKQAAGKRETFPQRVPLLSDADSRTGISQGVKDVPGGHHQLLQCTRRKPDVQDPGQRPFYFSRVELALKAEKKKVFGFWGLLVHCGANSASAVVSLPIVALQLRMYHIFVFCFF